MTTGPTEPQGPAEVLASVEAALAWVEWRGEFSYDEQDISVPTCPSCGNIQPNDHGRACELAAAIASLSALRSQAVQGFVSNRGPGSQSASAWFSHVRTYPTDRPALLVLTAPEEPKP